VTEVTGETEEIATAGRDARAGEEDETATAKRLTEQKSQRKGAKTQRRKEETRTISTGARRKKQTSLKIKANKTAVKLSRAAARWGLRASVASLFEDGEDVVFTEDQVLLIFDLDLVAGVLAEQHAVTARYFWSYPSTVFENLSLADGNDLALLGLFLGCIRNDDAALLGLFRLDPLHQDAIM
jgi:hypothetical protein